jgi:DNA polymerase III gamma/tau subunit
VKNLALCELYRPQKMCQIVGQSEIKEALSAQLKEQHARSVLIVGPTGSGKSLIGGMYAIGLLCKHRLGGYCGYQDCDSCRNIKRGNSLNFKKLQPEARDDETIREIVRTVRQGVYSEPVAIFIDQANLVSENSFEILSSFIARPPDKTTFIICAESEDSVPSKIRDSLSLLRMTRPSLAEALEYVTRLCDGEAFAMSANDMKTFVEGSSRSFRGLARDLELVMASGLEVKAALDQLYLKDIWVEDYLLLVLNHAPFKAQWQQLNSRDDAADRIVNSVRAYLLRTILLVRTTEADEGHVSLLKLDRTIKVSEAFASIVALLQGESKSLLHRMLKVWEPSTACDEASLLSMASEFDILFSSTAASFERQGPAKSIERISAGQKRIEKIAGARRRESKGSTDRGGQTEKIYLSSSKVRELWEAGSFLTQAYGLYLNTHLTIRYQNLRAPVTKQPGGLLTELLHELRIKIDRVENNDTRRFHWLYVHRDDNDKGLITEIVAHVPVVPDCEPRWLHEWMGRFFERRGEQGLSTAISIRGPAKKEARHVHLELLGELCAKLEPNARNQNLIRNLGMDLPGMNVPVGPKRTSQRAGVSRSLSRNAQRVASAIFPIVSPFELNGELLCSGWEMAEHNFRRKVYKEREDWQKRLKESHSADWRLPFEKAWTKRKALLAVSRPTPVHKLA